ncbi:hypothetical protein [Acetobacter senegalensis]|uniref:hypothetical protein n=1 Tax=Acetobacter senegalensis TaxID=446692 RepID=UPI00073EB969|nr:hypothetical protein [Acetobacter senegalensis]
MLNEFKNYIKDRPVVTIAVTVVFAILVDRIIMSCSSIDLLKIIPTSILGAITAYIAYQQYIVSRNQKELAEDKHKLELFEKRFETYQLFLNVAVWSDRICLYRSSEMQENSEKWKKSEIIRSKIQENFDVMVSLGEQSRFLFGEDVFKILADARVDIFTLDGLVTSIREIKSKESEGKSFIEDMVSDSSETIAPILKRCREIRKNLFNFYSEELPKVMGPYLKIAPYKNADTL